MVKTLSFFVLLILIGFGASFVSGEQGLVTIDWLGYKIEGTVGIFIGFVLGLIIIFYMLFRLVLAIKNAPERIVTANQGWKRQRGYKALTQGMIAVAAGDASEAKRLSLKAEKLLSEPSLTMLLSAQAAQLSGDEKAAGRFFKAMTEEPETRYLGLSGQLRQALEDGDHSNALQLAEEASNLNPKTDTVSSTLFELQIKDKDWKSAGETVRKLEKTKIIKPATSRRHQAILLYLESLNDSEEGKIEKATQKAKKAFTLCPDFTPNIIQYAELLHRSGKRRKAVAIIEESWVINPHPNLVNKLKELVFGAGTEEIMRTVEKLSNYNSDHMESHLAIASSAISARMLKEAREHIEAIPEFEKSARACRYMAEIAEVDSSESNIAKNWLKKAAAADPDPAWICGECKDISENWVPTCSNCEKFDTLIWDTPPRITRIVFPEDKKTEESNFFEEGGTMETSKEKTGHHKNN